MYGKCSMSELVDVVGKTVKLCCNSSATHRIEEKIPEYGPSVHYLCTNHRRDLLPMCDVRSEIRISRLGGKL